MIKPACDCWQEKQRLPMDGPLVKYGFYKIITPWHNRQIEDHWYRRHIVWWDDTWRYCPYCGQEGINMRLNNPWGWLHEK